MKKYGLLLILLTSCHNATKQPEKDAIDDHAVCACSAHHDPVRLQASIEHALTTGDKSSYNNAAIDYELTFQYDRWFYLAFVFGNKYNSKEAFYDIYHALTSTTIQDSVVALDSTSASVAYYYLMKAYQMGHEDATREKTRIEENCKCKLNKPSVLQNRDALRER